jgi:hypothetical protein
VHDKNSFLHACAEAMHFPIYFGYNWDALWDSLTDLSWAPAQDYLLLYDDVTNFARHASRDWATARKIWAEGVVDWRRRGIPFLSLLRRTGSAQR